MGRRNNVWEARDKLFSSHFQIRKIGHQDSGRSTGQDQFMNQEWYRTSKSITQIMIVFIISFYEELKTQI